MNHQKSEQQSMLGSDTWGLLMPYAAVAGEVVG